MRIAKSGRWMTSLGRAELLLFARNPLGMVNALLPPLAIVALAGMSRLYPGPAGHAALMVGLLGLVQLGTVYHTLVGTYVARREDRVLKQLRVGELGDARILVGTAVPMLAVALVQMVLYVAAASVFLGLPAPVDPLLFGFGALAGIAVFAVLAAASATLTPTVDTARFTTMPIVLCCLLGSGLLVPVDALPGPVGAALRYLPLAPAVRLMDLGWSGGSGRPEAVIVPTLTLAAWTVLGVVTVRRWFRWDPRR